jgi:4-carboxymuconolactone decarboxylase
MEQEKHEANGEALIRACVLAVSISASCQTENNAVMPLSNTTHTTSMLDDIGAVSPALEHYTKDRLFGDLWKRPDLSPRDRCIVTLAALIARNQTVQMTYYFNLALYNGVKPNEISEIITHLAFYSGWENAMSAVAITKDVFRKRGIGPDQLPAAKVDLLPLNEDAEKQRATSVEQNFGTVAPGGLLQIAVSTPLRTHNIADRVFLRAERCRYGTSHHGVTGPDALTVG